MRAPCRLELSYQFLKSLVFCLENEMEAAFAQFRESVKLTPSHASWVALTGETSFMAEPK